MGIKKILAIFFVGIIAISNTTVFATELTTSFDVKNLNQYSTSQLSEMMKTKEQELNEFGNDNKNIYYQNDISSITDEQLKKEQQAMEIKNEMADIKIELLRRSGELYEKEERRQGIKPRISGLPFKYNGVQLDTGDIIIFKGKPEGDFWEKLWGNTFIYVNQSYTHVALVLDDMYAIEAPGKGQKSRKVKLSDIFSSRNLSHSYNVYVKKMNVGISESFDMYYYAIGNLQDKPYNFNFYSIDQTDTLYCTQLAWLAFKHNINIDIDRDGGIIFPVDIVLNNYGTLRELYSGN